MAVISRPTLLLLLAALCCLCACGGPGSGGLTIPQQYVSDTVVVPQELQDEYAELQSGEANFEDVDNYFDIPLAYRRAEAYLSFAFPQIEFDKILMGTSGQPSAQLRSRITSSARALGLAILDEVDYAEFGVPELGMDFVLQTDTSRTRGELAWLADQMIVRNPEIAEFAEANGYDTAD